MTAEWIISVDDHLIEPAETWTEDAPASIRDVVPRLVDDENGRLLWMYEDVRTPIHGVVVQAGRDKTQVTTLGVTKDEMLAAYWDPDARLACMDGDNVLASLCFPYFPRFCGQTFYEAKDKKLAAWCVQRYNDWVIDSWCGGSGGRLIPLIIVPLWDPQLAAAEVERCAAKGAKAVTFSENPTRLGLPSVHTHYWDPLFAATSECGLALAIHFGSSSTVPTTSADAPSVVSAALAPTSLAFAFTDWIFSGVLDQFRDLKMLMSEGGIGWIPYMIQRCETTIRDQLWTLKTGTDGTGTSLVRSVGLKRPIERSPREIFDAQIYGCFIDDAFGCRHLDEIGVDNVLIETDFPHGDSSYPTSLEKARDHLSAQTDEVRQKVLRGNAARLFDLHFADELMAPVRA